MAEPPTRVAEGSGGLELGSGVVCNYDTRVSDFHLAMAGFAILLVGQMIALQRPTARLLLHLLTMVPATLAGDALILTGMAGILADPNSESTSTAFGIACCFLLTLLTFVPYLHLIGRWQDLRQRIEEVEGRVPSPMATGSRTSWTWPYATFELQSELSGILRAGDIRLISTTWLMVQPPDYRLQRRQDLPAEAFVSCATAVRLLEASRIVLLSYRWLSEEHPDQFPAHDGFHLTALRAFFFDPTRPLLSTWRQCRFPAIFWDYGSLYQSERTAVEDTSFRRALEVMANAYASPRTIVLQHKLLPFDFPSDQPTYEASGWCTMEQAAACLMMDAQVYELGRGWVRRPGKRKPEEMRKMFSDEKRTRFVGRADREKVADMYDELYSRVRRFDAVNVPCVTRLADRIVSSMPFSVEIGALLLTIYFGGAAAAAYLISTFSPFSDNCGTYPGTTATIVSVSLITPILFIMVSSRKVSARLSAMLGATLIRMGFLYSYDGVKLMEDTVHSGNRGSLGSLKEQNYVYRGAVAVMQQASAVAIIWRTGGSSKELLRDGRRTRPTQTEEELGQHELGAKGPGSTPPRGGALLVNMMARDNRSPSIVTRHI